MRNEARNIKCESKKRLIGGACHPPPELNALLTKTGEQRTRRRQSPILSRRSPKGEDGRWSALFVCGMKFSGGAIYVGYDEKIRRGKEKDFLAFN